MVVDIFGLLPDSAVFLVRRGAEESGAKLVVRDYVLQANSSKRTIVPEQSGVAKEEMSSLFTTRGERPPGTGLRTIPMGWVLQGQLR
jgi:hypothetical protein